MLEARRAASVNRRYYRSTGTRGIMTGNLFLWAILSDVLMVACGVAAIILDRYTGGSA